MLPRKISATMASQHPDHASVPFWFNQEYIPSSSEVEELMVSFSDLGIDEYKWDWEGKLVDENVIERLFSSHFDYFKENQLGKDKFITYRLPNPYLQSDRRFGRALMGILSASGLAKSIGLATPPLFEVILPMCESAHSMIDIQEAFAEISSLKHWLFGFQGSNLRYINLIPLFEQAEVIANSDQILAEYIKLHEDRFGYTPAYLRPYVARSDPALNSGHIATTLAIKQALSKYTDFSERYQIPVYPIIGCAALLFRGGLNPLNVPEFVNQYAGVKTVLIQSAFRYDYTKEQAIKGIQELKTLLPETEAKRYEKVELVLINEIITLFENPYRQTIEKIASKINEISNFFPKRRERVQHTGLFGYSRGVGKVTLPRAIKFTGSLYSIGLPPSIIGAGRGLRDAEKAGFLNKLLEFYPRLKEDLQVDCRFLNLENILNLENSNPAWSEIVEDIKLLKSILGVEIGPGNDLELKHLQTTTSIFQELFAGSSNHQKISELITQAGILRKSLG